MMSLATSRRARVTGVATAAVLTAVSVGSAPPASAAGQPPRLTPDVVATVSGKAVRVTPLANDTDPERGPLTLSSAALAAGSAAGGSVAVAGSSVTITPRSGFVGRLVVNYTAVDNESLRAASTITVTVAKPNRVPVLTPDSASIRPGTTVTVSPLANDKDPDGDPLRLVAAVSSAPAVGSVRIAGSQLVIGAAAKATGRFSVTYTAADGRGGRAAGTVAVTVVAAPANRAPVARNDRATVTAGTTTRIKVLANDSDPDGDPIKLSKVAKPSQGKAKRKGSTVRFTAARSASGSATVRYTIKDSHGAKARAELTITIKPSPKASKPVSGKPSRAKVEAALKRLKLPVGSANGRYDSATRRAVCAWRTIVGRKAHRGLPSSSESKAIVATDRLPKARSVMVNGVTISVTCQAAFWVGSSRSYKRVMAASTGKAGYRTRRGTFRVFRSFTTWRYSTIYPEARMYKPMQFSGGQAIHGSATDRLVKTYPASHGCVRMLHRDIDALHRGGMGLGSRVRVIGTWKG